MADEPFSLQVDTDWKKQAQEEKRRLAEEQAKRANTTSAPGATAAAPENAGQSTGRRATPRELPPASVGSLVQTLMTQALFYMGELPNAGGSESINLDMAKLQIDTLGVLEDKTKGNLSADEQKLVDAALYETRMRFVSVASQYL